MNPVFIYQRIDLHTDLKEILLICFWAGFLSAWVLMYGIIPVLLYFYWLQILIFGVPVIIIYFVYYSIKENLLNYNLKINICQTIQKKPTLLM